MTIDGGPILQSGHWRIDFKEGYAPTADWFYPANSARAFASGQYDYHGEWWTEWFDTDDNSDGIENESYPIESSFKTVIILLESKFSIKKP